MQYPPLHYFIIAGIAKIGQFLGVNASLETLYIYNRAFSLLCNVLLCGLIFRFLQSKNTIKRDALFWASIIFVAATMPFYNRMDALYWLLWVVFIIINLRLGVRVSTQTNKAYILLAISAFFAALLCLTKQSAYGLITLHFLFFIKIIGWRKTIFWAALCTIIYSICFPFMVENLLFFYQNTVLGLVCKIYFKDTIVQFFTNKHFFVLLPLLAGVIFCWRKAWQRSEYYYILLLAYSTFFAFVGIFKAASDVHYFAETTILVCVGIWAASRKKEQYFTISFLLPLSFVLPLFFVKTISLFYKIHVSHFIHNEAAILENEKAAAEYLKLRLNDTVFAHIFYTSTIPARLQQHIITPQPDVFSAVSDQNLHILNADSAFLYYNKPDFCLIRNDETIQGIHNRLRIDFPKGYQKDAVFGKVEVWKQRF